MTAAPGPHPVEGFYGPASETWWIDREAILLGAGPAALLLQIAHPLIAEGVAQHSDFLADPFGRLRRTIQTTMDIVFGDAPTAERAIGRLNRIHAGVRGAVDDPQTIRSSGSHGYRALDPELLLWVQATLAWTSIQAHRRWVSPVSDAQAGAMWQETRAVGVRLGIPLRSSPADWPDLLAYWDATLASTIRVGDVARRLSPTLVRPASHPKLDWAMGLMALPGLALLPTEIRDGYRIPWGVGHELVAGLISRGLRLSMATVPAAWRSMPQARAADRRVRGRRSPA